MDYDYSNLDILGRLRKFAANMKEEVKLRDDGIVPMDKYRDEMKMAGDIATEAADEIERLRNAPRS